MVARFAKVYNGRESEMNKYTVFREILYACSPCFVCVDE